MMEKEKENVTLVELKQLESKFLHAGLKRETIVLLLHNLSNVGKPDVRAILIALEEMERAYVVPEVNHEKKN